MVNDMKTTKKNSPDWHECKPVKMPYGATMRVFQAMVDGGHLNVLVGREPMPEGHQWHLSISFRSNSVLNGRGGPMPGNRLPTWEEISEARYRFCPDETYMAMILPPKSEYVNLHPTTMHLHEVPGDK